MELSPWRVEPDGVRTPPDAPATVDLQVAGRRVWSFDPRRDAREGLVRWPPLLTRHLHGSLDWQLVDHATGAVLGHGVTRLGSPGDPDAVVDLTDSQGHPLAITKAGRLKRMFEAAGSETRRSLVQGIRRAIADSRDLGSAEVFLAFGCLLGAVRDGRVIGHDNDADVAMLCRGRTPVDVCLESYRLEHLMQRRGWEVKRMSGGSFKIYVRGDDGSRVGVDVFGAWYDDDGTFWLLPNVRGELSRDTLLPPRPISLEQQEVLAPRDPLPLLELTYGPGWRVPDPAFSYKVPDSVKRRVNGWFRGERNQADRWAEVHLDEATDLDGPSSFAEWVAPQLTAGAELLDAGCGSGRDAVWFAQNHVSTVRARDFSEPAYERVAERAAAAGVTVEVAPLNFADGRDLLTSACALAFATRPRDIYCRRLLEHLDPNGWVMFWRFCSMVQRRGGRTFVEMELDGTGLLDAVGTAARDAGGVVDQSDSISERTGQGEPEPRVGRVVVSWPRGSAQRSSEHSGSSERRHEQWDTTARNPH